MASTFKLVTKINMGVTKNLKGYNVIFMVGVNLCKGGGVELVFGALLNQKY